MFDYRYHALSLAAVLLSLALGILIGIAIGDSSLVSSAKNGIVHDLNAEIAEARRQAGGLQRGLAEQEAFADDLYPLAVHELLSGRSVGLVFLGSSSDQAAGLVRTTVTDAGAALSTVVAVREPLDLAGVARAAAGTHFAALASSRALVGQFGQLVGRELVSGGPLVDRSLLGRARASLMSAFDGQLTRLEGLVVMRVEPSGMTTAQREGSEAFEMGLLAGVAAASVPAVGVELRSSEPSQVSWYKAKGIASVDDLDALAGQAALAYALAGSHGAFGVKPTADSLLPSVTGGP